MIAIYYVTTNGINRVIHINSGTMQLLDRYTEPDVKRVEFNGEVPANLNFHTALRFTFDDIGNMLSESLFDADADELSKRCLMVAQRYAGLQYLNCNSNIQRRKAEVPNIEEVLQNAEDFWYPTITTTTDVVKLSGYLTYLSEDELKAFDISRRDVYLGNVAERGI